MEAISSWASFARLTDQVFATQTRLDLVHRQIGSGKVAQTFGGLGAATPASIDGRAALGEIDSFQRAIVQTESRLTVMQTVLDRLGAIAGEGIERVIQQFGVFPPPLAVLNDEANTLLEEVRTLLNTAVDGDYLFNGRRTQEPPVPAAISISGLYAGIQAALGSLAPGNAATVIATTFSLASSNASGVTPFSSYLSAPPGLTEARLSVRVDIGFEVAWGVKANANGAAVSDPPTTGSAVRDLIRGLTILANVNEAQRTAAPDDFRQVLESVRAGLASAKAALAAEAGALGETQKLLAATRSRHEDLRIVAEKQVGDAEDADLGELSIRRSLLQSQLEASFRIIASLRELTLARFLG